MSIQSGDTDELSLDVPPGTALLHEQVAGHKFGRCKFRYGLLRHLESGDILKPVVDKRSQREQCFYATINASKSERDLELKKLLPKYKGLFYDPLSTVYYLRLENISERYEHSSVMDVKIGAITYDPEASPEKIEAEINKYKHAQSMEYRILGMRVCEASE